jgi:hypothetical protein
MLMFDSDIKFNIIAFTGWTGWRFLRDPTHVWNSTGTLVAFETRDVTAFCVEKTEMETAL